MDRCVIFLAGFFDKLSFKRSGNLKDFADRTNLELMGLESLSLVEL